MAKYVCGRCNFKFEPRGGRVPKKCPFCARDDTLNPEASAQEILNTSDGF